jgi:nucleotide-binding universal stress UspA family protein
MASLFRRLLLATERTEFDVGAERLALVLAKRCALPLGVVLPVVTNAEAEAINPTLSARAGKAAAQRLGELLAQAQAMGVSLESRVRGADEAAQAILDEAREYGAELLIVRRRGKRGLLARLLVGEMVSTVAARAACPVLMVPRAATLWSDAVLAAVHPAAANPAVARTAAHVALQCGCTLELVCVAEAAAASQALDQAARVATEAGCPPVASHRAEGPVAQSVVALAGAAGLIVVGRHGAAQQDAPRLGRVTREIVGLATGCVLVVPN